MDRGSSSGDSVAVVGLGLMGRPIARRLTEAGVDVRGWNRTPLDPQLTEGIALIPDAATAAGAGIVVIVVSDSAATGAVLAQLGGHLCRGSLVVDMGSSDPGDSRARAAALAAVGIGWLDAPVSGGPEGAAGGSLAIMAGGSETDFERVRPLLQILGSNVARVGGAGAGHAMKIVNQVIVGLSVETVAEAMALAAALGFDPALVQEAVRGGSADNPQVRVQGSRMGRRLYPPGGRIRTLRKDLRMALRIADEASLELPVLRATFELYERAHAAGAGDQDCAVLYEAQAADGRLRAGAQSIGSARATS